MTATRYYALDGIRGLALLNMITYHAVWDLVYLFDINLQWYQSEGAYIWQQCICWTFIFLSGFCEPLGKKKLKRGIIIFSLGFLIVVTTLIALPQNRVRFGVLTLIGSCMLLMIPAEKVLQKCRPLHGLIFSIALFLLTKNINQGYLGFANWNMLLLPDNWYHNFVSTYLGFPMPGFHSTDYFSLLPWVFLYTAGYFTHRFFAHYNLLSHLESSKVKSLEWFGRHSLGLYMIHQPLLYFLFAAVFAL